MGTINYFTSDYITLGAKLYDTDDYIKDNDFMNFIREEWNIDTDNENEVLKAVNEQINMDYEADWENAESILNEYSFYYFNVVLKPGYYEGFTLDIENNFGIAINGWEDRREAQKEITQLKNCLLELAGVGLVACSPGWCTSYKDYNETIKAIKEAIKEIREEYKTIPTWRQYQKEA